jgi:hypothetical protein
VGQPRVAVKNRKVLKGKISHEIEASATGSHKLGLLLATAERETWAGRKDHTSVTLGLYQLFRSSSPDAASVRD